jgi:flagellar hook-basal body complex protein FliE
MSIGTLDATSAYGRSLSAIPSIMSSTFPEESVVAPAGNAGAGASFGTMVESMIGDAGSALRQAETASVNQVAGKGDLVDVVTAIGAAETALDTVVAVRDKVVGAYSQIMSMQI